MKKLLLTSLIFTFTLGFTYSQSLKMDVIFRGDKVGWTHVSKTKQADGKIFYELKSESNASFMLMKRAIKTHLTSTYENGMLVSCVSKYEVNGKLDSYVNAKWDGTKYNIETDRGKFTQTTKVSYSVLMLYFLEPTKKAEVWSERIGAMLALVSLGNNQYQFKNAIKGGAENIYKFKNGQLYEVEMSTPVGASYMRVVN